MWVARSRHTAVRKGLPMTTQAERLEQADGLRQSGRLSQAAELYAAIWREDPHCGAAAFQLGTLALQSGDAAAALPVLLAARELHPDSPDVRNNLGAAYKELREFALAEAEFHAARRLDPENVPAIANLGELAQQRGDLALAATLLAQALELDPEDGETAKALGDVLLEREQWLGAEECYLHARQKQYGEGDEFQELDLLSRVGLARLKQEKLASAESLFRLILDRRPDLAEIHANLSFVLERQGKIDEAITAGREAVRLRSDLYLAYNNLAIALRAAHRFEEARDVLAAALVNRPGEPLTEFNHGTICLQMGDYAAGWPGYEFRNQTVKLPTRSFSAGTWSGRPQPDRTLLVHPEQGFGDSIQFVRLLPQVQQQWGGRVVLECPEELMELFQGLNGVDQLVRAGDPLPRYDAQISLASLPGRLGLRMEDLPVQMPYLKSRGGDRKQWSARLDTLVAERRGTGSVRRPRIGLVWQGNPNQAQDVHRSCPLMELLPLVKAIDADWFSLQKGERGEEQLRSAAAAEVGLIPLGPELAAFHETAAVLKELDLLISVDTSIVHLAGSLGVPVWTLLAHTADWRWEISSDTSAWYPTMRLFRPAGFRDWASIVAQVKTALAARFPGEVRRAA